MKLEWGRTLEKLTELEKDALREVGYIGAGHAATALSKLVGQRIDVSIPVASAVPLAQLPEMLGGREELVTGVYLPLTGDLEGSVLLVFPQRSARTLVDLLMRREVGTTTTLSEIDQSALKEVGNILSGNCLTALSQFLGMRLVEHIPDLAHDMVGAVVDAIIIKFGQRAEQALVIVVEMTTKEKVKIRAYFFLLFGLEEAETILKAIKAKVSE